MSSFMIDDRVIVTIKHKTLESTVASRGIREEHAFSLLAWMKKAVYNICDYATTTYLKHID